MRTTEIYYILHEAIQAHREVAIQIEAIDCNGSYKNWFYSLNSVPFKRIPGGFISDWENQRLVYY